MVYAISNELSSIKTTLIEREKSEILRNQLLEQTVISNQKRIEKLEGKYAWVVRTILASIIGAGMALIIKFGGTL